MNTKIGQTTLGELMPLFIFIFILLLFIVLCIRMIIVNSKVKKAQKSKLNDLKANGLICNVLLTHVNGLPIPENTPCEINYYNDKIEIVSNGAIFNLATNRITDMCLKTDVEIQKQYVSSVGGAICGAALFGPLGAVIGGRSKQKKSKDVHTYLIITYQKNDTIEYIGFESTCNVLNTTKLVNEFRKNHSNINAVVDL